MTIRCHFDGKVFVPDEPVKLPVNQEAHLTIDEGVVIVDRSDGNPATVGDLLKSGFVGLWEDRTDIVDSLEYARALRSR